MFGPYPLDELTVVTVPRSYSQATLGFVTLSSLMMYDLEVLNLIFRQEDRRTVIAHEVAHQWWAHQVGWSSYRDQWISEAVANYAALLFARNRLDWKDRYGLGPTAGWQEALSSTTSDGRTIESIGPVVLGERLFSSRSGDAYEPIVYRKGAVILDMLARTLGEENFPKVLRQIVKAAGNRPISTGDFLTIMEKVTSVDLDWFAKQYVYGTGPARGLLQLPVRAQGRGQVDGRRGGPAADALPLPLPGGEDGPGLRRDAREAGPDPGRVLRARGADRDCLARPGAGGGQGQEEGKGCECHAARSRAAQGRAHSARDRGRARAQGLLARSPRGGLRPLLQREPPSQADARSTRASMPRRRGRPRRPRRSMPRR